MITAILLITLGTTLALIIAAMFRVPAAAPQQQPPAQPAGAGFRPAPPAPSADPLEIDAWDARKGDIISVHAAGDQFADLDFPVTRRDAYEAKSHRWTSLAGDYRGQPVTLEIYRFPQAQMIGFFDSRQLSIPDLGISEDQLADFDAHQDPTETIQFDGRAWTYESSREIGYFKNEIGEGEGLYRWLFAEAGGPRIICIEKWEDEPFDIRLARRVEKRDITVYRA